MRKIVLATGNAGKVAELRSLLGSLPVTIIAAFDIAGAPDVIEDGETLHANALKKALALHSHCGGLWTLADDTGLMVNALGGAPGVYSARYAGENCTPRDNRQKLLEALKGHKDRSAAFCTVIVLVMGETVEYFEGVCKGRIARQEHGSGGFGYDPIFIPDGMVQTFAELDPETKNSISHRGRAMNKCLSYLQVRLDSDL